MTTPFPFVAGQVLTAAQLNDIQNLPISDKTASYTLVVADVYKRTIMNNASATTITVNNSIFTVGDVIQIANKGAGTCTITAGAGVTINTSGTLALAQYGGGYLLALSASTFTFFNLGGSSVAFNVDYLIIAGGGGSGGSTAGRYNGAGGAGGYLCSVSGETSGGGSAATTNAVESCFKNVSYLVTVGAGGAGGLAGSNFGSRGSNSVFVNSLAVGGGGGGYPGQNGLYGGSGAGGGDNGGIGGPGIRINSGGGQGFTGSDGAGIPPAGAGGGAGGNASSTTGGVGLSSSITGSAVTRAVGGSATGNVAGAANTGNGAGGNSVGLSAGSAGGSGVVILRYADTLTITIGGGLTGTESAASGGYKRATITAGTGNVSWS